MNGLLTGLGMLGTAMLIGRNHFYLNFNTTTSADRASVISMFDQLAKMMKHNKRVSGANVTRTADGNLHVRLYEY
jgi:hypothetical protein